MSASRKLGADTAKPAGNRGKGRPKGSRNKVTVAVKDMILQALDEAGGIDYLLQQSKANPTAFMTLVGKVLPLDVNANVSAVIGMPDIVIGRRDD